MDTRFVYQQVQLEVDKHGDHDFARLQYREQLITSDQWFEQLMRPRKLEDDAMICVYLLEQHSGTWSSGGKIDLPAQNEYSVGCFQNQVLPPAGDPLPEILYAFMATSTPDHIYFGWHVVQTRSRRKKVADKAKVASDRGVAGPSNTVIDLTNEQGKSTGGKKRRMDRWDQRPNNTDAGNGARVICLRLRA
jgi:hypothetical protein